MENTNDVGVAQAAEVIRSKKTYQQPNLVEQGQWTEKTLPPISGSP